MEGGRKSGNFFIISDFSSHGDKAVWVQDVTESLIIGDIFLSRNHIK